MAAKATERVHPDWNPWMAQLTDGTSTAMALDAREGTHPVVQTVNTLDDANLAFDTITYEKASPSFACSKRMWAKKTSAPAYATT
jgi:aminopeptidase N